MAPNSRSSLISVVLPMYNEGEILTESIELVVSMMENCSSKFEIICVNDGSTDETEKLLGLFAKKDHRVKAVTLSKNFGKEPAIIAGLDTAQGDAVIVMDSDLQHPPDLLPKMIQHWENGADIVECQKINRGRESLIYKGFAAAFNAAMSKAIGADMKGASDFKLLDRKVVDVLKQLPEQAKFFRGLVSWVGFESVKVPFEVAPRLGGSTTWSRMSLIKYALNNILAFTNKPLLWTAWVGALTTLLGLILMIQTLWNYCIGVSVSGFTTVILSIIFFAGTILLSIGVVAIYVGRVFDEVKNRPVYILKNSPQTNEEN